MSETEEKPLDITIEDEKEAPEQQSQPEVKIEEIEKSADPTPTVDEAVATLKVQLEAETNRRLAAEARAREAATQAHTAQTQAEDAELQFIASTIETVKAIGTRLKAEYANAMRAQDYDAVAEIQEAIATNASKLLQLETGKQSMEAAPKLEPPKQQPADRLEAICKDLSPREAEWLRAHSDFAYDDNKLRRLVAAHNLADAEGLSRNSDEYFRSLETTLRIRPAQEQKEVDPMTEAAKVTQRRAAPAAAPVSRSGTGTGDRPGTVRLSAAEREIAADLGMTVEAYAKNKYALIKEGKLH